MADGKKICSRCPPAPVRSTDSRANVRQRDDRPPPRQPRDRGWFDCRTSLSSPGIKNFRQGLAAKHLIATPARHPRPAGVATHKETPKERGHLPRAIYSLSPDALSLQTLTPGRLPPPHSCRKAASRRQAPACVSACRAEIPLAVPEHRPALRVARCPSIASAQASSISPCVNPKPT